MQPLTLGRAARGAAFAVLGGAAAGVLVRVAASAALRGADRAAAAMTVVLAVATVAAACARPADRALRGRLSAAAVVGGATWFSATAAGLAAGGGTGAFGGALVPAAVAVAAFAFAGALRSLRVEDGMAAFAAAALASIPSALIFIADPWVEARGATAESPRRARVVVCASPIAAMTSPQGGLGADWLHQRMLYDSPSPDGPGPGLSAVAQFYPSSPPSPVRWAAAALGIGAALVAASRPRR